MVRCYNERGNYIEAVCAVTTRALAACRPTKALCNLVCFECVVQICSSELTVL